MQSGELGVNLSVEVDKLRRQTLLARSDQRQACGHDFQLMAGIWLDRAFQEKAPTITVKAQSDAYFRILEQYPEANEVLRLGNQLVWVTPSEIALVIATGMARRRSRIRKLIGCLQRRNESGII